MIAALAWFTLIGQKADTVSWLPPDLSSGTRFLVCQYQRSKLKSAKPVRDGRLVQSGAWWTTRIEKSGESLDVRFRLEAGSADSTGIATAFDIADWDRSCYLMIPGVVYNGNRFRALPGEYMPAYPADMFFNPKVPIMISNNPRLAIERDQGSKIELLTGNASTPGFCLYVPSKHEGTIILAEQGTQFGNSGLIVEESPDQKHLTLVVSAPGVRERAAGFGGFSPSGDLATNWRPGQEVRLKFRVVHFPATGLDKVFDRFLTERKSLIGPNAPRNLVPMSKLADITIPRFKKRWMTQPAGNYYAPENSEDFQLGWVSGFMQTPLLARYDPLETNHICDQLDFVTQKLQGPSGYFYAGITAKGNLRSDREFQSHMLALTRKNGDTLLYYLKFFRLLGANGNEKRIKPEWETAARRLADAFCRTWSASHEFGQYVDPVSGKIGVFNSSGGAVAVGALAQASQYFKTSDYLKVAQESAEFYYRRDILTRGFTGGACGDISQDPDSETSFAFVGSLVALYEVTGDRSWLVRAQTAAALASSWTLSYDYRFPSSSQIGKLDGHMAGAVFASAQNKHAAPGICTSSGDYLFKLFRATGDTRYSDLIRDIQHAQVEAVDMPGHPTTGTGTGASMERIQPTDAEGKGQIGNFYPTQNAWTELDGLMMATELPGIYVQSDSGQLAVYDHVEATVVQRIKGMVTLKITNPTPYDADVSVFVESKKASLEPLSPTAYLTWPKVKVKAGENREVQLGGK